MTVETGGAIRAAVWLLVLVLDLLLRELDEEEEDEEDT